jgi:hypothetical protein
LIDGELLKQVGGCDKRLFIQDYSLSLRLSLHTEFAIIDKLIAYHIDQGQSRLSSDKLKENKEVALARLYFIQDHPELDYQYKKLALQAHLRKASSWCRRKGQWRCFFAAFRVYIKSLVSSHYTQGEIIQMMERAVEVYK